MKHLYLLVLLCLFSAAAYTQDKDSLTLATRKVEGMVQDIKKKELLEQKLLYSEQQVKSFYKMDSLLIDLRVDLISTIASQQGSINDLVKINQGSAMLMSGIKEELKDVRLNFYNDNVKLRNKVEELETKNDNKNKIIVGLGTLLATIIGFVAF